MTLSVAVKKIQANNWSNNSPSPQRNRWQSNDNGINNIAPAVLVQQPSNQRNVRPAPKPSSSSSYNSTISINALVSNLCPDCKRRFSILVATSAHHQEFDVPDDDQIRQPIIKSAQQPAVHRQSSNSTKRPQVAAYLQQENTDLGNNNTPGVSSQVGSGKSRVYPKKISILTSNEAVSNRPSVQGIQILEKKANFKDVLMKDLPPDQEKTKEEEDDEQAEEKLDDGPWEIVKSKKGKKNTAQEISNSQRRWNGRDRYMSTHQNKHMKN